MSKKYLFTSFSWMGILKVYCRKVDVFNSMSDPN